MKILIYRIWGYIVENSLWVVAGALFHLVVGLIFRRSKKSMLEGKEVEGKIGEIGSYSVDVQADADILADVSLSIDKELTPGVKVKLTLTGGAEIDAVALLAAQAAKSDNAILKFLAEQAAKLKAGQEVHPDVVAAATPPAPPAA